MRRETIHKLIETLGGKVGNSVSKNTDLLVVGSDPGSKFDKAKELGVQTCTLDELLLRVGDEAFLEALEILGLVKFNPDGTFELVDL